METHAHELHKTPGHGWKHYLFEFFMLFLAVFCGFLAENFRESLVERNNEHEYIISMIEDLKADTTAIAANIKMREDRQRRMDSLSLLLHRPGYQNSTGLIYYYARWTLRFNFFYPSDRTLQQLKNAGGMRLIRKRNAANAIIAYDEKMKRLETQTYSLEAGTSNNFQEKMAPVFDGAIMDGMYEDSLIKMPDGNPALVTNDASKINSLLGELHFVKSLNKRNIYFENSLKEQATATIMILKEEYHLKESD